MKLTSFSCQARTAPSPSQSPTPFAEGGKLLPGKVRAPLRVEEREEGAKVARSVVGEEEKLVEVTEQKQNLATEEDREKEAAKEQEHELSFLVKAVSDSMSCVSARVVKCNPNQMLKNMLCLVGFFFFQFKKVLSQ